MRTILNGQSVDELTWRGKDLEARGWTQVHPPSPKITEKFDTGRFGQYQHQFVDSHTSYFSIYEKLD